MSMRRAVEITSVTVRIRYVNIDEAISASVCGTHESHDPTSSRILEVYTPGMVEVWWAGRQIRSI